MFAMFYDDDDDDFLSATSGITDVEPDTITNVEHVDYVLVYDDNDDIEVQVANNETNNDDESIIISDAARNRERRKIFETNLRLKGFQLVTIDATFNDTTKFVLITAPDIELEKLAEKMQIRKAIKLVDDQLAGKRRIRRQRFIDICQLNCIRLNDASIIDRISEPNYFTAPFVVRQSNLFIEISAQIGESQLFTDCERIMLVYDTLIRTKYDVTSAVDQLVSNGVYTLVNPLQQDNEFDTISCRYHAGVDRLVDCGAYTCAYPLHEPEFKLKKPPNIADCNDRELLFHLWVRQFFKYQPLALIRRYYGSKIGMYFGWLGYYTTTLIAPAIVGVLVILYGILTVSSDIPSSTFLESGAIVEGLLETGIIRVNNLYATNGNIGTGCVLKGERTHFIFSKDVCNSDANSTTSIVMCPNCEIRCDFWRLSESCTYAKLTHIFDNISTVLYAAFMSLWATLFIEGFKRYRSQLAWQWDLLDLEEEDEPIRPEYQYRVRTIRKNPITEAKEPFLPRWQRVFRIFCSGVTVTFSLLLVLAFVAGIMVHQFILVTVFYEMDAITSYAVILATVISAVLNLIVIRIMNTLYIYMAVRLTNWERPRTQTDFDNSYSLKVFLFQFINYYSSLFYIAFIKGRVVGVPKTNANYHRMRIFGYELETCNPAGCIVELVIQLAIIMVGNQFIDGFMEIIFPIIRTNRTVRRVCKGIRRMIPCFSKSRTKKPSDGVDSKPITDDDVINFCYFSCVSATKLPHQPHKKVPIWERDLKLSGTDAEFLCGEYLELVMQFGFVTLFVAAFPLAPLFAFANNLLEIRIDAYKLVVANRRPVPARAKNIGIWLPILEEMSKLAVISNACVIAFTSELLPKILYSWQSANGDLSDYVEGSLSHFTNASDIAPQRSAYANVSECRYFGNRKLNCNNNSTSWACTTTSDNFGWWQLLIVRITFIVVFVLAILLIKATLAQLIPDMPSDVQLNVRRERYHARRALRDRWTTAPEGAEISMTMPRSSSL